MIAEEGLVACAVWHLQFGVRTTETHLGKLYLSPGVLDVPSEGISQKTFTFLGSYYTFERMGIFFVR